MTKKQPKKKISKKVEAPAFTPEGIIFDMDNVLIDTRASYLEAIRWTVEIYLTHGKIPYFVKSAKHKSPGLLSAKDVHDFKLLGGFNDDWDCCYGILIYLLSLPVKKRTTDELKKAIKIKDLLNTFKRRPVGVDGITKRMGRPTTVTIEKIGRIFQEVYLGKDLFPNIERARPIYWKKRGLIHKEKLIIKRGIFEKLINSEIYLGIATGRPLFEAAYALKHFKIDDLFHALTSMDDVKHAEMEQKQSLRKPHPFSVIETANKIDGTKSYVYVGDLPDDVLAANQAKKTINIRSVAFPAYTNDSKAIVAEMQKAKPDYIIKKPAELLELIKKRKRKVSS